MQLKAALGVTQDHWKLHRANSHMLVLVGIS